MGGILAKITQERLTASEIYARHDIRSYKSERFVREFNATVRPSNKVIRKYVSAGMPPLVISPGQAFNKIEIDLQTEDVPCLEIVLGADDYENLVNIFNHLEYLETSARKHADEVARWEKGNQFSIAVRNKNPAVQKAYEKYMALFNLVRNDRE